MLRRKIYQKLVEWKNCKKKECLVLKGARQVGKTTTIREFGRKEYESLIEMNFLEHPEQKEIFAGALSSERILQNITLYLKEAKIIPHKTLLFLDEIQACGNARTALKFLAEAGTVDVIASGSLLGLVYYEEESENPISIPVGYETTLMMYSLDFEEFLWALGYSGLDTLKDYARKPKPLEKSLFVHYQDLFRQYLIVGGMPEVVFSFAKDHDFTKVQALQDKIIASEREDIVLHAKGIEKVKIRQCFESIPFQLARENKKFKYADVEKKGTARKFGDSIQWLVDSNLALRCTNVSVPALPLRYNEKDNEFKLYLHDTGLLFSHYGTETKLAFMRNVLKGGAKGGIYENAIAEMLVKKGYSLHYYKPKEDSGLEFLIEKDGEVRPIEVKAGNNATKSLNGFIDSYHPSISYKIDDGNVGMTDGKLTLPYFLAMLL